MILSLFLASFLALFGQSAHAEEISAPGYEPPSLDGSFVEANVFGQDRRRELRVKKGQWATIGRLMGPEGSCTATLVGKDLILTAAHCIMNDRRKTLTKGVYAFYPAMHENYAEVSADVVRFWWGTTDPQNQRGSDWAIGRINRPLGTQLGWLGVKAVDPAASLRQKNLALAGYSADYKQGTSATWINGCSFTGWLAKWGLALHDCSATRGSSGGAMLWLDSAAANKAWVVGVNVAEMRRGGDTSLVGVPYSDSVANVAIPVDGLLPKLIWLRENKEGL